MAHAVFSIQDEILERQSEQVIVKENIDNKPTNITFDQAIEMVSKYFDEYFQENENSKIDQLDITHQALLGDLEAELYLTAEIESYLRENNLLNVPYPEYYESLAHGIFQELFQFGVLYKWKNMMDSPGAVFLGDEFWIERNDKYELQPEKLRNRQTVEDLIRRFQASDETLKVNHANPEAEIALKDATRVKIIIPPATYKPTLVFRKYTVKKLSFEDQAELKTIPKEDIQFYKVMSQLMLNTVVAGHVKSGKSTFLKTIYGARDKSKVAVLIEGKPESLLKKDFPERLIFELYSANRDINDVIEDALRLDHDYIIVQEVRGKEAEGAVAGTERGRSGLLMSYHLTNPRNTPRQLAQHIVDTKANRHQLTETRRVLEALDIGITMESVEGQKRVTAIYEMGIKDEKHGFVNYLVQYDEVEDKWLYNSNISEGLKRKIYKYDADLAEQFINHLKHRESIQPLGSDTYEYIRIEGE